MEDIYQLEFDILETVNGQVIAAVYWEGARVGLEGLGQNIPEALTNLARDCKNQGFNTKQDITDYVMKGANGLHRDTDGEQG